jgi:hypothetical protein
MSQLENSETVLEAEIQAKKIKEEIAKALLNYQNTIVHLACDAPISILCLSKKIEKVLLANGLSRVYDLLDRNLIEIEGLDEIGARDLATSLNKFIAMF